MNTVNRVTTAAAMRMMKDAAARRPVTKTRRGHAKLTVGLTLALEARDELAEEVEGHRCKSGLDEDGRHCPDCCLGDDATHVPYQLETLRDAVECFTADGPRLAFFADNLNDVLGQWLDADMVAHVHAGGRNHASEDDDLPVPDVTR